MEQTAIGLLSYWAIELLGYWAIEQTAATNKYLRFNGISRSFVGEKSGNILEISLK